MIKNVVIDCGHGGVDDNGNYTTAPNKMHTFPDGTIALEGILNREIGEQVYNYLADYANLILTVGFDEATDLPLINRVKIANQYNPKETIFVSIHCNASPNHNASGFEIFSTVGQTESDVIATSIVESVKEVLSDNNVKLRADNSDGDPDKESNFYVIRKTMCPAVLIECGFFDNQEEYEKLNNPDYQYELGRAIAKGIVNYIESKAI